jgi:hypothetical protein
MHPFLDVTKLSDEEIIDRLGKSYAYMNYQSALGHNATVQSIREVVQALEDERQDRTKKNFAAETLKKFPDALKPIELGKLEEQIRRAL